MNAATSMESCDPGVASEDTEAVTVVELLVAEPKALPRPTPSTREIGLLASTPEKRLIVPTIAAVLFSVMV